VETLGEEKQTFLEPTSRLLTGILTQRDIHLAQETLEELRTKLRVIIDQPATLSTP